MQKTEKIESKYSMGLIFFPAFDWQISPTHPERRERLLYTRDQIYEEGLTDIAGIEEFNPHLSDYASVKSTHICVPETEEMVDEPHLISAGGAIRAAELWLEKEVERTFALVRPPGHHAMRVVHGARGFCTINNEAIMVDWLLRRRPDLKIAFVDTDAHHADGTQDIFYHNPRVLHISLHQDGRTLFPGTGFTDEAGGPGAYARTLNVPLPPGTGDAGFIYALKKLVRPVLDDFSPDLVINAAGQDNHFTDPITNMNVTARGYGKINEIISPDLAVLQGGYAIESALPYVNIAVILAMAGMDYSGVIEPDPDGKKPEGSDVAGDSIRRSVVDLKEKWQKRGEIDNEPHAGTGEEFKIRNGFYYREKGIYYDTDNIREEQQEYVKICDSCPGFIEMQSKAAAGAFSSRRVKIFSLPHRCCSNCREEAREKFFAFKHKGSGKFDGVYWQDRSRGELEMI